MDRSRFVRGRSRRPSSLCLSQAARRAPWEALEPRQLLCSTLFGDTLHDDFWATSVSSQSVPVAAATPGEVSIAAETRPDGLPILHSLPAAPTAVYLDFDGYQANTPYDTDGQPATFGAAEQAVITEAWRHIASYFSMFNTNVTTIVPTVPYSYSLISNSHQGVGYSYLQFPTTTPSAFNPSGDASSRQSGLAHEIGHNFGLPHQSDYDRLGNKTNEYSSGFDRLHGPIMGVDFAQDVHKWFIGHGSGSPSTVQDDVAIIAGRIRTVGGVGDGFRPDDVPNAIASARALTVNPVTATQAASGIIERLADADAYSFTSYGGQVRVDVVPPNPSALDAKVEIYAPDGSLVAAADAATNDQHLTLPALPAGTYYAVVKSAGGYGDLGQYDLTVTSLPSEWAARDVGAVGQKGNAGHDASGAAAAFGVSGGGADIGGSADEFHLAYTQLASDGSVTARVLSVENTGARALGGVTMRESLSAGSRHMTIGLNGVGSTQFRMRATTNGSTTTSPASGTPAPYWVRLVRSGTTVTGYRSVDGVTWTQQGTGTLSATATVYVGLATTAGNDGTVADARFDSVALEGDVGLPDPTFNDLPAPANLVVTQAAGTGLAATWDAVEGASGYVLERSPDGAVWAAAATLPAGQTSHTETSLAGSQRYFYRVSAQGSGLRSVPSALASAVNRPSPVTSLAVTSWTTSQVILNWRDARGESGYRIERAAEGSDVWTTRATVGANVPSWTDNGLTANSRYRYRVVPTSPFGDAPAVEVTGSSRLPALTGLQFTERQTNRLSLQWNPVVGATGYRVERSSNGEDFTTLTTVGSAATTYDDRSVQPLREYFYRVVGVNSLTESTAGTSRVFTATPSATALPAGWDARDIGGVGGVGATGSSGTSTFTVISSGRDIWEGADAFRFTYQTLVGNGSITARVSNQENTTPFAKAGVMIRETLNPSSRHAFMALTPENGTAFQWRSTTGGASGNNNTTGFAAPYYVRLVRSGNTLTGFRSADGVTWTQQGTTSIAMASSVFVGLAVVPGDNNDMATVTFSNVALSNNAPTIATPAAATPSPLTGTEAALSVRGADDHGEPNLFYTWTATSLPEGAAPPVFSANGTNAAKSVTATFSKAGTYVLQARVADLGGLSVVSTVTLVVEPTLTRLGLTPAGPVRLEPGAQLGFAAAALDQFGEPIAGGTPPLTWTTTGGTVGADGVFVAPAEPGTYTVTATVTGGTVAGSAEVVVAVEDNVAPTITGASSYKSHGAGGPFAVPLALGSRPAAATVEPRRGGPTTLVFSFSERVAALDGVLDAGEFDVANASFVSATLDAEGRTLTLTLTGVADRTVVSVALLDLADAAGNGLAGDVDVSARALFGDADGNGLVNDLDTAAIRRALGRPLTDLTAVLDLDLDGTIDATDLLHARRNSGASVL